MFFSNKREYFIILLFLALGIGYLFPLLNGLIILPLDLLISSYAPWYSPGTILLKNPYMQDPILQIFPWRHLVFKAFEEGIIPFWNPYQFMGGPFMASIKPMVFYPLNIFFVFGEIKAWNALLFSQVFLSLFFSYILARDFKLRVLPSMLVSFSFAFNSFMMVYLQFVTEGHTLIWFPLFLLFAKRFLENKENIYLLLLGLVVSFSIFAGHFQFTVYMLIVLVGFIMFYGRILNVAFYSYILLGLSIFLGVGITAIQTISSIELFIQSHRGLLNFSQNKEIFITNSIELYQHARLFSADFFGNPVSKDLAIGYTSTSGYFGIIPFFFSLFAMCFARKNIFVKFFTFSFFISLLLSLKGISEIVYLLRIPVSFGGSAERIFFIAIFSASILSGFGITEFIEKDNKKKNITSIISFIAIFSLIIVFAIVLQYRSALAIKSFLHNVIFPFAIFGFFSIGAFMYLLIRKKTVLLKSIFLFFIVGLTYFDLFRLGYRFLTFSNEKFLYPEANVTKFIKKSTSETLDRTFGLTEPEIATYLNMYVVEAYNPLYLQKTRILLQTLQGNLHDQDTVDNKYFLTSDGKSLKHTLDFLGVKFIVVGKDDNPSSRYFKTDLFVEDLKEVYRDDKYIVYANNSSFPRFGLYCQFTKINNEKDALELIKKNNIDFRKKVVVSENLPISSKECHGVVKLVDSNLNMQRFKVEASEEGLLYVSDAFFPGWIAKVNNKESKIFKTNYAFRSVIVPRGTSIVEFLYTPSFFKISLFISVISIILLSILGFMDSLRLFILSAWKR